MQNCGVYLSAMCGMDCITAELAHLLARRHSTELQMTAAKWFVIVMIVIVSIVGLLYSVQCFGWARGSGSGLSKAGCWFVGGDDLNY